MSELGLRREDGAIAGLEVVPLGLLVFAVGTLLITNVWAVIDAKLAVSGASREAVRAAVEAPPGSDPQMVGTAAAVQALLSYGRTPVRADINVVGVLERCARVTAVVRYRLPAVGLAWVRSLGPLTATATATEVVDPLRSGLSGEARCVR